MKRTYIHKNNETEKQSKAHTNKQKHTYKNSLQKPALDREKSYTQDMTLNLHMKFEKKNK